MKILLVKSVPKLTIVGILAAGLKKRGHDVHVLVPSEHPDCGRMRDLGIRVHKIGILLPSQPGWKQRLCYWKALALIVLLLYRYSFDVINAHLQHSRLLGRQASLYFKKRKKAVVSVIHGFESKYEKETNWIDDVTVTALPALRRYLAEQGIPEEKIAVIPNGIDIEAFDKIPRDGAYLHRELGIPCDVPLIGMVAYFYRDRENKGHQVFLDAAKIVAGRHPVARFVLVGGNFMTPDAREYFERYSEELGINGRVHFLGEREDIPALMSSFYANVLASYKEGFAMVILEAMARAVPNVTTGIGSLREIIEDGECGLLFEAGNSDMLAEKLLRLLGNPEEAVRLGLAGRKKLETHFTRDEMARRFEELFETILRSKSSRRKSGACRDF